MRNLYHTLELTPNCTSLDVKRAFRKLAHQYHPDHNATPIATQQFQQIMEAYTILGNDAMRAKYDALLASKSHYVASQNYNATEAKSETFYKKYGTIAKFKRANPNYVVPKRIHIKMTWLNRIGFYFMLSVSIYSVLYSFFKLNAATTRIEFELALNSLISAVLFAGVFLYCWFYVLSLRNNSIH